jgi:hypothetical protein
MTQASLIVFDPLSSGVIWVCSTRGLIQTMNAGAAWIKLSLPTSSPPYAAAVSLADTNLILVALNNGAGRQQCGLPRSSDRGLTFTFANQGLSTVNFSLGIDQQSIAFNPAPPAGHRSRGRVCHDRRRLCFRRSRQHVAEHWRQRYTSRLLQCPLGSWISYPARGTMLRVYQRPIPTLSAPSHPGAPAHEGPRKPCFELDAAWERETRESPMFTGFCEI